MSAGKGLLDEHFVLGVSECCCLVKHDDGRILQNRPGKRDALLLAAGEIGALRAELGVDAVWELGEDVPALGGPQRIQHLLARGVRGALRAHFPGWTP